MFTQITIGSALGIICLLIFIVRSHKTITTLLTPKDSSEKEAEVEITPLSNTLEVKDDIDTEIPHTATLPTFRHPSCHNHNNLTTFFNIIEKRNLG